MAAGAVPADRAEASSDGQVIELAGRPLRLIDTPGHRKHHHAIWDAQPGLVLRRHLWTLVPRVRPCRAGLIPPTSTPVQWDPVALKTTVARLLEAAPTAMYLTTMAAWAEMLQMQRLERTC